MNFMVGDYILTEYGIGNIFLNKIVKLLPNGFAYVTQVSGPSELAHNNGNLFRVSLCKSRQLSEQDKLEWL